MTRSLDEVAGPLEMYVEMVGVVIGHRHLDETQIRRERRQVVAASRSGLVRRHGDRSSRPVSVTIASTFRRRSSRALPGVEANGP
jgi:hypothetical protein